MPNNLYFLSSLSPKKINIYTLLVHYTLHFLTLYTHITAQNHSIFTHTTKMKMQIFVKSVSRNKSLNLNIESNKSIAHLKALIAENSLAISQFYEFFLLHFTAIICFIWVFKVCICVWCCLLSVWSVYWSIFKFSSFFVRFQLLFFVLLLLNCYVCLWFNFF